MKNVICLILISFCSATFADAVFNPDGTTGAIAYNDPGLDSEGGNQSITITDPNEQSVTFDLGEIGQMAPPPNLLSMDDFALLGDLFTLSKVRDCMKNGEQDRVVILEAYKMEGKSGVTYELHIASETGAFTEKGGPYLAGLRKVTITEYYTNVPGDQIVCFTDNTESANR